jgi:phosphoenolpyruvate-protein kinase (PTS system EI component)
MDSCHCLAASGGTAIGPALGYLAADSDGRYPQPPVEAIDAANGLYRLQQAIEKAQEQVGNTYEEAVAEVRQKAAAIFLAH